MPIDTPEWVRDAVFYQVFPDRFAKSHTVPKPGPLEPLDAPPTNHGFKGGDLIGVSERLDELVALGITAPYLTPVFSSASNPRYHAYDYLAVDPLLGGDGALRVLLDRAHERGMKVILDGVFNHCGRGFWPFHHVLENGAASPYRKWFHLDPAVLAGERPINAYPDRAHSHGGSDAMGYRAWWGMPALPKFNIDEPAVREYLLGVAEHWLRFGIDGWRLDVPGEIDDERFWQEFRRRCRAIDPDAYLVGEIWDEAPDWLRGDRFDALMNYPLGTAILGFAGGSHLDMDGIGRHDSYRRMVHRLDGPAFAGRVEHLMANYDPAIVSVQLNLVGSHDTPRALTILGGDRLAFRLTTLLQATLPGAPCIYTATRSGWRATTIRTAGGPIRPTAARGIAGCGRSSERSSPRATSTSPCAGGRSGPWRRRVGRWRSCARRRAGRRSSRSMPARRRPACRSGFRRAGRTARWPCQGSRRARSTMPARSVWSPCPPRARSSSSRASRLR